MKNQLEITAEAVREQVKRGEAIFFVEVRHAGDKDLAVMKIRGALRLTSDNMQDHLAQIPRELKVVVYSTAPDDDPAIRAARLLLDQGFPDVQVVVGGFKACLIASLPVEDVGEGKSMTRLRGV